MINISIKELRKQTGLSQTAFGNKYGIPMRTIQDWESGKHKAPNYVIEMLNKLVQSEKLVPMAWVRYEYRDKAGTGSTAYFNSESEAIESAMKEWNHMNESDQNSYINDPVGEFIVALIPMLWDDADLDYYPNYDSYTPVWSAF